MNDGEERLENTAIVDLPKFEADGLLNKHNWAQFGQELVCLDDPSLSGILPLGYVLVGSPGKYELEKIF